MARTRIDRWFSKSIKSAWGSVKSLFIKRSFSLKNPPEWFIKAFGEQSSSGETVNEKTGIGITAVYTCLNIVSQTVASLPVGVKRRTADGQREPQDDHPVHRLIHVQANARMSAYNFWSTIVINLMGWGNAFAFIARDERLNVTSLEILYPWDMQIIEQDGEYQYIWKGTNIPFRDLLHFRMFSDNGIIGISPIRRNMETMGLAIKQQKYAGRVYGTKPPGILVSDQPMDAEQREFNKAQWQSQTTGDEMAGTPVLSGMRYEPIMIPPGDAEFIESRKMTKTDVYGIFRIPPTLGQDYERATFANAEQQDLVFVKHTLMPIVTCIERECNTKLFPPSNTDLFIKFNMNGILRGDIGATTEFLRMAVGMGIYSPKRALQLLDEPFDASDDRKYIQSGFIPVELMDDFWTSRSQKPEKMPANERELAKEFQQNGNGKH